jgi:hypothetical protein
LESYAQRQSEYRLSNTQLQAKLIWAGQDGFWFLSQIDQTGSKVLQHLAEVEVLRQELAQ